jgi:hypothetical protein
MTHISSRLRSSVLRAKLAALALFAMATAGPAQSLLPVAPPVLPPGCEALQVPTGHQPTVRVFARGLQVYRFDQATGKWVFSRPLALLFADPACQWPIGTHNEGPTWAIRGSMVVGNKLEGVSVEPTAVPWLLLEAVDTAGFGALAHTTFIQRLNTVGGLAPTAPGAPGQIVLVPYTAEYVFYRAQ